MGTELQYTNLTESVLCSDTCKLIALEKKYITKITREYSKENAFIGEKPDPLRILKTSLSALYIPIRKKIQHLS